ncbi:UxaA family hydrolase [Advenella kashmirensis]
MSDISCTSSATFEGIVRANGQVGTRNYVGVFVAGNCAATSARKIADWFNANRLVDYPNVDGVVPFVHEIGCGMEMTGEPMDLLRRTLSGFIRHPNMVGALVLALGCERNNIYTFMEQEKLSVGPMLQTLVMQELGGTTNTVDAGIAAIEKMLPAANDIVRQSVPAKHLSVGLLCAGDDVLAARTASPALGAAIDILVKQGGTAILTSTSSIAPLAQSLVARAESSHVKQKLEQRIQWWHQYTHNRDTRYTQQMHNANTDHVFMKTLEQNARRAGTSSLKAVYEYAEPVNDSGLIFMDAPSFDAVSATGQIASGANMICLATGVGSSFGSLPAPAIKLAATTALYKSMEDDFDIDCGIAETGALNLEQLGQFIFEKILSHASGIKTKSEIIGIGENEFVPWPIGAFA